MSRRLNVGAPREQARITGSQAARRARRDKAEVKEKRLSTPGRIAGYTDGVFAVVITITVLELHPPASAGIGALLTLWPTAVSYLVSYVFVAIIWINHHFLMGYIKRTTLRVIWLNFIHLFFVSLLPFATGWIAATELARAPVVVYTSLCVVTDGAYNLFEREVLRNSRDFSPTELRASRRRSRTALALFAAAAVLALIQPLAGMGFIALALLLHLRPDAARKARADGALHRADRRLRVGSGLAGRVGCGTGEPAAGSRVVGEQPAWHAARPLALSPGLAASGLARRACDLRQPPCHWG